MMRSTHRSRLFLTLLAVAAVLLIVPGATAQEHPEEAHEHPEEGQEHPEEGQEHPEEGHEHPEEASAAADISKEQLAAAIRDHVESVAEDHGGTYPLEHPDTGETLQLELEKVHEERLARTAPNTYFACVDFVAEDGTTYDVDFFMHGESAEALEFEDFSLHKVDGEPRYTWHEKDGTWMKKPTGAEGEHEHPEGEHPDDGEEHPDDGEEHPDEPPAAG